MSEDRITARPDGHWLVFDKDRRVAGCHCGFEADADSDCGWGDSVVEHLWRAAKADGWDEGNGDCCWPAYTHRNPYRSAPVE